MEVPIDQAKPDASAEWWTTSEVAAYLGLRVATVSSYRMRGQMPEPDMTGTPISGAKQLDDTQTQVAEWAGHSVDVLLRVYAKCIAGPEEINRHRIEEAFRDG